MGMLQRSAWEGDHGPLDRHGNIIGYKKLTGANVQTHKLTDFSKAQPVRYAKNHST